MPENQALGLETGLYLLTPTHCGTGQASGAVDLPIARERHTDHPLIPATALKGVARDLGERSWGGEDAPQLVKLFGPKPPQPGQDPGDLSAGALVFTDGHLLAFPVRSVSAAFYWVTCPLIIERWVRARKAMGLPPPDGTLPPGPCATLAPMQGGLLLEDLYLSFSEVAWKNDPLTKVAASWARLLDDKTLGEQLRARLVCLSDADFGDLVRRCTPVNARVQLTPGKTTDRYKDSSGKEYTGNLWYEETLPSDCLFSVMVTTRGGQTSLLKDLRELLVGTTQIGGNETVGQGLAWWRGEGS